MRGFRRGAFDAHLFVAATLALPEREKFRRVGGALVDGAVGRDDFAAAVRTCPPAETLLLDFEDRLRIVCHRFYTAAENIEQRERDVTVPLPDESVLPRLFFM